MSIKVLSEVWENSKASGVPLLVLLSLADYADDDGECWPSIGAIRRKCRLKDDRHVKRVIHETLERELGEVVVIPLGGKASQRGGVRSNRYRIAVHLPDDPLTMVGEPPSEDDRGSPTTLTMVGEPPLTVVHQPPEPSVEPSGNRHLPAPASPTPSGRRRDALFDAVAEVCGIDPSELTSSARGATNRALADLRSVGATPEDVRDRAATYRRTYPRTTLTPSALAKHWPALGGSQPVDVVDEVIEMARRAGR
ncbi:MAG: helix-turn-helix domain-containing protein [Acidimicrobiales bacterium]